MAATDTIEENEKKHKIEIDLCKVADAVVAVGSRLQQKYSRSLPNVKVEIITPGIFENFSSESQCAMHKSFLKNFNVFLFGRATFEDLSLKGYDIVANAIGSLGERFELTFVGSSPGEHKNVEEWFLKETCINPNQLYIRGYCNNPEEVKTMFHQSDLVALPSRTEGFGLVALEAISAAVPVLVSGESGIAEALRKVEGGRTVIVGSYKDVDEARDEWARRIREMSEESAEEREANARKLCENYRKVYSWKAECTRFKEMIESVMESVNDGKSNIKVDVKHVKPADDHSNAPPVEPAVPTMEPNSERQSDTDLGDLQLLKEKILCRIAMNYLDTTPPRSSEEHNKFMEYLKKMRVVITGVSVGSLVITVKCDSLKSLEELWENYSCGLLDKMVQDCFVTENILKELNLAELKLKTTMDIEEYNACKLYFEKDAVRGVLSSEFHSISSTSESSQKQEDLKKWKQKTKIEETVEMKGALSAQSYSTGTEDEAQIERWKQNTEVVESEKVKSILPLSIEELDELLMKLSSMKELEGRPKTLMRQRLIPACTSLSSVLSTAGHEKELEGRLKTFTLQEEKRILPPSEEELDELLMKLQSMKGTSLSTKLSTAGHGKELEGRLKTMTLQEEKRSLPSSPLSTTDLEEKLEEVCLKLMILRKKGSLAVPESSTSHLVKKLAELCMELIRLRMEGTLPPPELFTADLEEELGELGVKLYTQRYEVIFSVETFQGDVRELLRQLQEKRTEALENTMYPTIRSGLAKFDVSLPEGLQSYVSYLFNESAKLGLRKRALHSLSSVEELREAMDEIELKVFLGIHIREGAWQVALLFMDELPSYKLPGDWFVDLRSLWEEEEEETISSSLYSSTSGILKAWPTEYDPDLVTLCKVITDRDWKVTRLILCRSRISEEGLKNLSTALTQGELYSLALCDSGLQRRGLKHLCEALISRDCNLTSLNVSRNLLGAEGIMHLCNVLTSVNCNLTSLNVCGNFFGAEGIMHLCNVLTSVNCKLTTLNVSFNGLRAEGIMHLCNVLTSVNGMLTSLNLSGNCCGSEGLKQLCDALVSTYCTLTRLNVSWNELGDEDIMHLFTVLTSSNCTLTRLNVSLNRAGDRALKDLARALTNNNCALTSLDISCNEIGDEGIKYLCKALTDPNCKLRSLDLGGNWKVTDVGKQCLSEAITGTDWEVRKGLKLSRSIKSEA